MKIETTNDNMTEQPEPLTRHVESVVKETLGTLSRKVAIVIVRLSDTNDYRKKSGDHRCMMEARMGDHPWISTSAHGTSLHHAIRNATEKLKKSIEEMGIQSDKNIFVLPIKIGVRKNR